MTLLFDLDGTLLDTAPDFLHAVTHLRTEENLSVLSKEHYEKLRPAVSEGSAAIIETAFGVPARHPDNTRLGKRLVDIYHQNLGHYTKPFPGIEQLLQALESRKIAWGIVTNKPDWLTKPLLAQQNLLQRAACIVSGDTTPYPKPHPEPLLYACRLIGVNPNECMYVGDAERDIIAGRAAGMTTIAALFGYIDDINSAKQWPAHYYVHHANEILLRFEEWLSHLST